jgi:hypothetical protein
LAVEVPGVLTSNLAPGSFALGNGIPFHCSSSQMLAQPGPFEVDLWPETHDAIAMCEETAKEWSRWAEPGPSREVWESVQQEIYDRCHLTKEKMLAHEKAFATYQKACGRAEELAKWEGKEDEDPKQSWSAKNAETLKADRTERDSALRRFHRLVGFPSDLPDPTLPGRTWLLSWPEMRPKDGGTGIQTFALLVVAAPLQILHEGEQHLICKADDMKKEDVNRHYLEMTIKAQPMRINEEHRVAWGRGMHWKGRVAYIVVPPEAEKVAKKPRRTEKTHQDKT